MRSHPILIVLLGSSSLLVAADAAAPTVAASGSDDLRANAAKPFATTGEDPTQVPTRIGGSYISNTNHEAGSNTDTYLLTGSLSLLGLQATAEVPVATRYNPGAGDTVSGFGDVALSGAYTFALKPTMRLAPGLGLLLDTASEKALGRDGVVFTPFVAFTAEISARDMAVVKLAHDDGSKADIDHWTLLLRGLRRWDGQLFTGVDVIPGYDDQHYDATLKLRGIVGANLDRHHTVSLETTQAIDSGSRERDGWEFRFNYSYSL
jgi:hypothetical protein